MKSQFHAIDKNKDGVLDKKEIKEGMKLIIGKTNRSEKEWQEFYKKIDIDGDGQVTFEEFVTAAVDSRTLMITDNIKHVFNIIDQNHDGFLSREELEESFSFGNADKQSQKMLDQLLKDLDKDNDG